MFADLTIETALNDPMIRAMMRADRVEPRGFERFLRAAAKEVATPAVDDLAPVGLVAQTLCSSRPHACRA